MTQKIIDKPKIGFIGQGFIGKNYADSFEERGYPVVRYSKDKVYIRNKDKIKSCHIVFIAVPTPTTPTGVDYSILEDVVKNNTKKNQLVVIKSTMMVGQTNKLQEKFKDRYLFHSPEFLTEKTAKYDAANPDRNIVGYTKKSMKYATEVMNVLPCAPYEAIIPVEEAELIKYAGNIWFVFKVMCMNMVYDIADANGLDYNLIKEGIAADKRVGRTHLDVVHQGGRGAGGHCFIKDLEAFRNMYIDTVESGHDIFARNLLYHLSLFNRKLLDETGKDLDLLKGVYGDDYLNFDLFEHVW